MRGGSRRTFPSSTSRNETMARSRARRSSTTRGRTSICARPERGAAELVNGGAALLYRASNPCHCSNQQFAHTQRDRKKVEILFSHLKRIPRLGGLRPRRPIQSAVFRDAVNLSTRRLKTPERRD